MVLRVLCLLLLSSLLWGCSMIGMENVTHRLDSRSRGSDPYVKNLPRKDDDSYSYEAFFIYELSEVDTKKTARIEAIEQAKALVAAEFAEEVTPEIRITNSSARKERVQLYSMAFMDADVLKSKFFQINEQMYLKTAIKATVNKKPLLKELDEIFKSELLSNLENQNKQLKEQLKTVDKELRSEDKGEAVLQELLAKRSDLQLELSKNLNEFKMLVEESKLIDEATKKLDRMEQHAKILQYDLFDEIQMGINLEFDKPYVIKKSRTNPSRSFIAVAYKWEIEPTSVNNILTNYFTNTKLKPQDSFRGGDLMRKETIAYHFRRTDYETLNVGIDKLLVGTTLGVKVHLGIPGTSTYLKLLQCNTETCKFYYKREGKLVFDVANSDIYKIQRTYEKVGNYHRRAIEKDGAIPDSFYY